MVSCVLHYQEEITTPVQTLRFDDEVIEALKMFEKLTELNCAAVHMEVKTFGKGVHVCNDDQRIG